MDRATDADRSAAAFPAGGGEMGARIRTFAWSRTPLGPIESWPPSLRTSVSLVLDTRFPTIMYWGPELTALYNDAYRPLLGARPEVLGRAFRDIWLEALDSLQPIADRALAGEASHFEDAPFTLMRFGDPAQASFDLCFSPLRDETGAVAGILNIAVETTKRRPADAGLAAELSAMTRLHELSTPPTGASKLSDLLQCVLEAVIDLQHADFGTVQLYDRTTDTLRIVAHRGIGRDFLERFAEVHGGGTSACGWALQQGRRVIIEDVRADPRYAAHREIAASSGYRAVQATPLLDRAGVPIGMLSTHFREPRRPSDRSLRLTDLFAQQAADLVASRLAEERLRQSEARYRSLFDSIDQGFCVVEVLFDEQNRPLDYCFLETNAAFQAQTGLDDAVGKTMRSLAPEHEEHWFEIYGRVALTGEPVRFQNPAAALDGRWYDVYAFRTGAPHERKVGILFNDITEHKAADDHQQLLLKELDHRVKNTLAMVQSIAAHTLRTSETLEQFSTAFPARLQALAQANDLLTRGHWQSTSLRAIAELTVGPHGARRVRIGGPDVVLEPEMAVPLHLALHELATNAAKYGALSVRNGCVDLHWAAVIGVEPTLRIIWQETGGPPVSPPTRRGFGSNLIERGLVHQLEGEVRLDFDPAGVRCRIDIPLSSRVSLG